MILIWNRSSVQMKTLNFILSDISKDKDVQQTQDEQEK